MRPNRQRRASERPNSLSISITIPFYRLCLPSNRLQEMSQAQLAPVDYLYFVMPASRSCHHEFAPRANPFGLRPHGQARTNPPFACNRPTESTFFLDTHIESTSDRMFDEGVLVGYAGYPRNTFSRWHAKRWSTFVPLVRKVGTATVIIDDDVAAQVGHRPANAAKDRYLHLHRTGDVRNR
jgi:hypothetical protein